MRTRALVWCKEQTKACFIFNVKGKYDNIVTKKSKCLATDAKRI
jgi:hypothetical protein